MHPEHAALLDQVRQASRPMSHGRFDVARYLGAERVSYNVTVPDRRRIAKAWVAAHKAMPPEDFLAVVDSLFAGASHEEKTLAAMLLACDAGARGHFGPAEVDGWLDHLVGWAEIDTLCQNIFTAQEMLADWPAWKNLIERLARDPNINRRRAALVLLNGPVSRSDDPRFAELAFRTIEWLKPERPVLITKAVSWLLRALTTRHAPAVAAYLEAQAASLPAIAVRETRNKLANGRKSPKVPAAGRPSAAG
jgi:3-methyladenine DNA glycosylase AlkD